MTEHDRFDIDLAVAMRSYTNDARSLSDAGSVAHAIALQYPRRHGIAELFAARPQLLWLLLAALLSVAVVAAAALALRPQVLGGGGLIAFSRNGDIYLAESDGHDAVLALDLDVNVGVVDWSPDGSQLLLSAAGEAYLLDPGTLELRSLGYDAKGRVLGWLPDGESVLVESYERFDRNSGQPCGPGQGSRCIFTIVDVETGATRDAGPTYTGSATLCLSVLSPDGGWVAAIRDGNLVVANLANGDMSIVADSDGYGCGYWTGWGWDAPTWSPDSTQIAFVSSGTPESNEPWTISIVNRDGSNQHEVVTNASEFARPVWSPDGQLIAYRGGSGGLAVVHPDGTGYQKLADQEFDSEHITWSDDSMRIDFARPLDTVRFEWWTVDLAAGQSEPIMVAGPYADGLDRQPMYDDRVAPQFPPENVPEPRKAPLQPSTPAPDREPADPSLVADGLAFDEAGPHSCDARIVWFNGKAETRLPDACSYGADGAWSPTGLWYGRLDAAFSVVGRGAIQLTSRDGSETSTLEALGSGNEFRWSPGANWLALRRCPGVFAGCESRLPDVTAPWVISDPNESETVDVPREPLWSPDDTRVAVASEQGRILIGRGNGKDLASTDQRGSPVAWSPDSSRLAYLSDGDVWVTDTTGATARNLTMFGPAASASGASWSPDGSLIAVVHGNVVWLIPPDGGQRQRLEFLDILPTSAVWSPDGSKIVLETWDRVILVDVNDPRPVLLTDATKAVWSPDGTMLALDSRGLDETGHIDVVNADGSGRREVVQAIEGVGPVVWIDPL